jgi:hypothetical protein
VLPQGPGTKLEGEPEGRVKWLEVDDEARLLRACAESGNENLLPNVTVALETGKCATARSSAWSKSAWI